MQLCFGAALVKCHGSHSDVTRHGVQDKPRKHCFIIGTIAAYQNFLYNMFITTFGIKRPFGGWDAYVFLHISIRALKKQKPAFLLRWARLEVGGCRSVCTLRKPTGRLWRSGVRDDSKADVVNVHTDLSPDKQSSYICLLYTSTHPLVKQTESTPLKHNQLPMEVILIYSNLGRSFGHHSCL